MDSSINQDRTRFCTRKFGVFASQKLLSFREEQMSQVLSKLTVHMDCEEAKKCKSGLKDEFVSFDPELERLLIRIVFVRGCLQFTSRIRLRHSLHRSE